jgi:hypothetical protein
VIPLPTPGDHVDFKLGEATVQAPAGDAIGTVPLSDPPGVYAYNFVPGNDLGIDTKAIPQL